MKGKDLICIADLDVSEVVAILDLADRIKANPSSYRTALEGRILVLYFEKPSLRTRVTFEAGVIQLGGSAIFLGPEGGRIGVRESVADVARNLDRWVDGIMCRTFSHQLVVDLAHHAAIPVINGLTGLLHPCQALADLQTLRERLGTLAGRKLAFVGDGNNVAHSLLFAGARTGLSVTVIGPPGHEPNAAILDRAREMARDSGARLEITTDMEEGLAGADAVYTDVWASMGQEKEAEARRKLFAPFQISRNAMEMAGSDALFLHCLPAHRGDEVTDEVADGPQSVIFDQAENRLHAQKALMVLLMGRED